MTETPSLILGIDEVGRGPWAGPLVIGAVILGHNFPLSNQLTDSKKLSSTKREFLATAINDNAVATGLGWVSASEIDKHGLSASLKLATRRAVKQVLRTKIKFDSIIIDGTVNFLQGTPLADYVTVLKKADLLVKEVSAASIIAKVARDNYMVELAKQYPHYGFEKHVGYGTAEHKSALEQYGPCPEHRQSFRPIRTLSLTSSSTTAKGQLTRRISSSSTTAKGQSAEQLVAQHLESLGHQILAHNFKTKTYEIDLISLKDQKLYFTEVKYRKNPHHGSALTQITPQKQAQMQYAATKFLQGPTSLVRQLNKINPQIDTPLSPLADLQPLLAAASVEGEPPVLKTWFPLTV